MGRPPKTYKLTLAYEGTAYVGWQFQENGPSVQAAVERALWRLTDEEIKLTAAGRTDSGVHALGQVVGLTTCSRLDPEEFKTALNALLPDDIEALECLRVGPDFHARYDARAKSYRYHIWEGRRAPVFLQRYTWPLARKLNPELLEDGLNAILGRHDFAAFQSTGSEVKTTVRTIIRAESDRRGRLLTLTFVGDGFLRYMVRAMVGTLAALKEPGEMERILTGRDRSRAGRTAPAKGLFMAWVEYPGHAAPISAPGPLVGLM